MTGVDPFTPARGIPTARAMPADATAKVHRVGQRLSALWFAAAAIAVGLGAFVYALAT